MESYTEKIDRLYEDMYYGRGRDDPSVTTRLDRIEQILSEMRSWKWVLIGAIVAMIADIISSHVKQ